MKRVVVVFFALSVPLGFLFFYLPQIDLRAAGLLYHPSRGFVLAGSPTVELLRRVLMWSVALFVTVCLALLVINVVRLFLLKRDARFRLSNWSLIYVLLALGLGPGLVINGLFKAHWGRARPYQVAAFGGDKRFTPAFVMSDQCEKNCSFVSGEAAIGFFGLTFMFVAQRRRRMIAMASIVLGSLVGIARMSVGAHFLSDVIFSGVFTFLVSYLLSLLFLRPMRKEVDNLVRTERELKAGIFFYRGYLQGSFIALLVLYVWFIPGSQLQETWLDTLADLVGIGSLALGGTLRIWAVSYAGRQTRSRRVKVRSLITTGPYACVRNPIYLGSLLIGLGLVVLAEAIPLVPLYFILFGFQYRAIVAQEEEFLRDRFGEEFDRYCSVVPRWLPKMRQATKALTFGPNFYFKELGTTFGIIFGAFFFEWIESPSHRFWLAALYHWVSGIPN
jgi:lipid A 4'-phosphatase